MALFFVYQNTSTDKKLLLNVLYSFIPTAVIGFLLHNIIKTIFLSPTGSCLAFVGMGLVFLIIEKNLPVLTKNCAQLTGQQAVLIGLAQACSVIPGVSRTGSVIVAMMLLWYSRDEAAKYTFLLSLPTIIAASALDLFQGRELLMTMSDGWLLLSVGFVTALAVAYFVVKWLTTYLSTHTLEIFGWYRLALAGILILFKVLP